MFNLLRRKNKPVITDPQKIEEILTRGVEDVFVKESLKKKLTSGKRLRVKLGFDPTGDKIHIGRAVLLRKLKAFQDLGHQVIFLVGDFTAQIGDPSDKLEKRPMLTNEKIQKNLKTYKEQVGKIVDLTKAEFYFNSTDLSRLTLKEVTELAESFSVQQMLARRNFKDRFEKGQDISLREFLYPLMQGYDSVSLKADIEIGGFDQLFNLKAGRIIQKHYGQNPQDVITTKMLEGTDGRKMSTSWGNVINIADEPNDMYGKVMSMKDELLPQYFLLCTDLSQEEIDKALNNTHPRDAKMHLAREIVQLYHSKSDAEKAEKFFVDTFSKKQTPENIAEIIVEKEILLSDALVNDGVIDSKSEYKRLATEGGIHNLESGEIINDFGYTVNKELTLRIGKKKFIKIIVK